MVVIDDPGGVVPNPKKDASAIKRSYTEDKKSLLRELSINVNKADGPAARSLFEKLKVIVNGKGKISGTEYEGAKIIIQKGKGLVFTRDVKKKSKLDEFINLVKRAEAEHKKTAVAVMEEKLGMDVNDGLAKHVLGNSIERLVEEISERGDEISVGLTDNEVREFRVVMTARLPTIEQQREGLITVEKRINSIKTEETHWRTEAERLSDPKKKRLYEAIADVAALKDDEIHLRANIRPESKRGQSIVEEEAENNDLTRFERFKRWTRRKLGGISVLAVSVAGIVTTIVMGARTVIKKGASATSKF